MIEVEHPTLGVIEFPDGTTPEQIKAAIQKAEQRAGQQQPQQAAQAPQQAEQAQDGMSVGGMAMDALMASPAAVVPNIVSGLAEGQGFGEAVGGAFRRSPMGMATGAATSMALEPIAGGAAAAAAAQGEDARQAADDVRGAGFQAQPPEYLARSLGHIGRGIEWIEQNMANVGGALAKGAGGSIEAQGMAAGASAAVPAFLSEVAGLGTPRRAASSMARNAARGERELLDTVAETSQTAPGSRQRQQGAVQLAQDVQPEQDIIRAAEDVGIPGEDVPPEVVSGNRAFRGVAGAARSVPMSDLKMAYDSFVERFNRTVEEVADSAGAGSRSDVNERVRGRIQDDIKEMTEAEGILYDTVDDMVIERAGIAAPVQPRIIQQELSRRLQAVGGDVSKMEALDQKLMRRFFTEKDGRLVPQDETWVSLSNLRRELNAGMGQGQFADAAEGNKKFWRGVIGRQQREAANELGVGEQYEAAMDATKSKKAAQDASERVLGRQGQKEATAAIDTALRKLQKGEIEPFRRVIEDIPADQRQETITTMVFDKIRRTSDRDARADTASFNKWFNELSANPQAKAELYKHLDAPTRKAVESLGTLNAAIKRANEDVIKTGLIAAADEGFQMSQRALSAMAKAVARNAAARVGGEAARAGAEAATSGGPRQVKLREAAADVLASPEFRVYTSKMARGEDVAAEAEALSRTSAWRKFLANSPEQTRNAINAGGITAFLTESKQEDEQ